jgi:hypothetical protein
MIEVIEKVKLTRTYLIGLVQNLTIAQLNELPPGFNNNIIWNLAHLVSAQQGLCYTRSGLPVPNEYLSVYKSGTMPEQFCDVLEADQIKELLISSLDQLKTDYANGIFEKYDGFTTRYGVSISNITDAISFIPFHEGLHTGYIMALKRILIQ